jgi:hypothetical protein
MHKSLNSIPSTTKHKNKKWGNRGLAYHAEDPGFDPHHKKVNKY